MDAAVGARSLADPTDEFRPRFRVVGTDPFFIRTRQ